MRVKNEEETRINEYECLNVPCCFETKSLSHFKTKVTHGDTNILIVLIIKR